ncbi:MAG: 50S ribosomal protein L35ae [Candidatus Bathyarchaeia archaeon]
MSKPVYGTILNYRIGMEKQNTNECLIRFEDVNSVPLARQLIHRKVAWTQGNLKLVGKIAGVHGKNGVVVVKFRKGVPGQALGTAVELVD